jgi:sugar phosphate isomerase/epimerase
MLPDLRPEEAATALAQAGYEGVEWRVALTPPHRQHEAPSFWGNNLCTFTPDLESAQRAAQISQNASLSIVNLGTYLGPPDIEAVEAGMRFAQRAGSPSLRVNPARFKGDYHGAFESSLKFFSQVEILARRYNLKALVEIHQGLIIPSASLTHRLVSHFDPAYIGVIYDPGNMVLEGFETYLMGLQLLGPYLALVHLKNAAFIRPESKPFLWQPRWMPLDDGVVNIKQVLKDLVTIGYDGWLSIEDFSQARGSHEALIYNLNVVKNLLTEVRSEQKT